MKFRVLGHKVTPNSTLLTLALSHTISEEKLKMAFKSSSSRFAFLSDDAPDPFVTSKKGKGKSNLNSSEGGNKTAQKAGSKNKKKATASNKTPSSPSNNSAIADEKQSLAFGLDGSKKKKSQSPTPAAGLSSNASESKSRQKISPKKDCRPAGMNDAQWEEWQQRDLEYVSGTFESDMEAALLQSKLDYQKERARVEQESQSKVKAKKKPVTVTLGEFNAKLSNGEPLVEDPKPNPDWSATNGYMSSFPEEEMERIRLEAQMEMKRERQLEIERQLLQSRHHQVPVAPFMGLDNLEVRHILEEKDAIITKLSEEKMELEKELEISKARFKKLWSIVGEANMKDAVFLSAEVEKLTQLNQHLTDEISLLHSQLEQEKSKSHAAVLECRKLEQSRRRTGSTTEAN
ncbi:unnamed protein product [Allacma fusca]|uniref:G kinase-anchoring protein 1 n=1 Tax=Allacma fusca TaxID=39272 RepID=A0A8J2LSD5_9HEXA|nr:unnamed protein product [Allacma fusca]